MTPARFVTTALLLSTILAARPASAQRYSVDAIEVDASILANGSMEVRETIAYDLRGRFTFAFRDIPRSPDTRIDAFQVREDGREYTAADSKEPGTFQVTERPRSTTRLTWYYRAEDERRTFDVSYRVTGEVRRYPDTAELYHKFVGEQWDRPIGRVRARVRFAERMPAADLRAWAHGPLHGSVRIADDGVYFEVAPLPARLRLARLTVPPERSKSVLAMKKPSPSPVESSSKFPSCRSAGRVVT